MKFCTLVVMVMLKLIKAYSSIFYKKLGNKGLLKFDRLPLYVNLIKKL